MVYECVLVILYLFFAFILALPKKFGMESGIKIILHLHLTFELENYTDEQIKAIFLKARNVLI